MILKENSNLTFQEIKMKILFILVCLVGMIGCGKEIIRFQFQELKPISKSIEIDNSKELSFWTDLEIEYVGNLYFLYKIKIQEGNQLLEEIACSPLNVSVQLKFLRTSFNDKTYLRYEGKMRCVTTKPFPKIIQVEATPEIQGNVNLLKKYDLVLKQ